MILFKTGCHLRGRTIFWHRKILDLALSMLSHDGIRLQHFQFKSAEIAVQIRWATVRIPPKPKSLSRAASKGSLHSPSLTDQLYPIGIKFHGFSLNQPFSLPILSNTQIWWDKQYLAFPSTRRQHATQIPPKEQSMKTFGSTLQKEEFAFNHEEDTGFMKWDNEMHSPCTWVQRWQSF